MTLQVKICGLNDRESVIAARDGGARFAGFVFYPRSPRAVSPDLAATLVAYLSPTVMPVGLFVDPSDEDIEQVLRVVPLRALQLHGHESPQRAVEIKKHTGLMIIKAIGVSSVQDIVVARSFETVADMLLLDAKPPPNSALPGGNAQIFEWRIAKDAGFSRPWMLAGGLTVDNIADAVTKSGARLLDISSGVEDMPGHKNPDKIRAFLQITHGIETSY